MTKPEKKLSASRLSELLATLKIRFEKHTNRHKGIRWETVQTRLVACASEKKSAEKLWALHEMEITGGEPDVVDHDKKSGELIFYDCAPESPKGRRSICYDHEALESRKEHKPANSAINMAMEMGIEILSEDQYRALQTLGEFDTKTSSWIKTPADIRKLGGAIFADFRYGKVFVYHNGAESYYGVRGFRGALRI